MRKLTSFCSSFLLILCVISVCVRAEGTDTLDLTGSWMLEYSFGGAQIAEQEVVVHDDNTMDVMDEDESTIGSWAFDGETMMLTNEGENITLKWDAASQQLTGEYSGLNVTMSRSDNQSEEADSAMLAGGWTVAEDPTVTDKINNKFQLAMDSYQTGTITIAYTPVAVLGTQVVAGTNHAFLCQATVVAPDAVPSWKIVFLYQDLQGNVSVLNIADFDFGELCTYGAAE